MEEDVSDLTQTNEAARDGTVVPRPSFHLTAQRNWLNDPNGLVFADGVWHAYYQYNPEGNDWGNMSWGHSSSRDLKHWDEHPVAIRYSEDEAIFSGSVVDAGDGRLVAFYTSVLPTGIQAQSQAVSVDGGYTWERNPRNPLVDRGSKEFRDPKVVRYVSDDGVQRWVMVAVEAVERRVLFYSSHDLESWTETGSFGPIAAEDVVWECPDLVELPVEGSGGKKRWVLLLSTNAIGEVPDPRGSEMHYVVGAFDGAAFKTDEPELLPFDFGRDMYAAVTFDSAPGGDVVALGWMSNWRYAHAFPTSPWRGAMSLARTLSLREVGGRSRLVQALPGFVTEALSAASSTPVRESTTIELGGHAVLGLALDGAYRSVRVALSGVDASAGFVEVEVDAVAETLSVTRGGAAAEQVHAEFPVRVSAPIVGGVPDRLIVSIDGPLLEVLSGDGLTAVSSLVLLGGGGVTATVVADDASLKVAEL